MIKDFYEEYLEFLLKHEISPKVLDKALHKDICNQLVPILVKNNPKNILEIGTFKGFSMGLFRYFIADSNVVSIDIVRYKEAAIIASLFNKCELIEGQSTEILRRNIRTKFDLVLIDGCHTYSGCKSDWLNIKNNMANRCMILFDDLGHKRGCGKVFHQIEGCQYAKQVLLINGDACMGILEKVGDTLE